MKLGINDSEVAKHLSQLTIADSFQCQLDLVLKPFGRLQQELIEVLEPQPSPTSAPIRPIDALAGVA